MENYIVLILSATTQQVHTMRLTRKELYSLDGYYSSGYKALSAFTRSEFSCAYVEPLQHPFSPFWLEKIDEAEAIKLVGSYNSSQL